MRRTATMTTEPQRDAVWLVEWDDAHADRSGGWVLPGDIEFNPYRVCSVGWRIEVDADHVSLVQSVGDDDACDHVLHIPAGMVRSVWRMPIGFAVPHPYTKENP
jgi:hypothetical protein